MSSDDRQRWNEKYAAASGALSPPSSFLLELAELLPSRGRALDLAGGSGRHALWLAERGLNVTLADVSEVGLGIAAREAEARGLKLHTLQLDVESEPLPRGPWDVICVFYFLHRPLFAAFREVLSEGGLLVVAHPTRRNLERHERPGPAHLLDEGELPRLVEGLEVLQYSEGWTTDGRHEARLVARR